jgi:hypothetical protein
MKQKLLAAVPLVAALAVGVSAFAMSPAACGCLSARMTIAYMAGMNHWEPESYDEAKLQAGLTKWMVGTTIKKRLKGSEPEWCQYAGEGAIECFAREERSWLLQSGYLVRFSINSNGVITKASVRRTWRVSA